MTIYYVRKTGSDSNNGTSPATAWATLAKALGSSSTGMSSGDTVYVGAGTYREVFLTRMTVPTAETKILADIDGSKTGDAGAVIWSGYLAGDTTGFLSGDGFSCINLNGRHYLTFEGFIFHGNASGGSSIVNGTTFVHDITFRKCVFIDSAQTYYTTINGQAGTANNWLFDSCIFASVNWSGQFQISLPRHTVDYDANIKFVNCKVQGGSGNVIGISSSGTGTGKGGGVRFYNSTFYGYGTFFTVQDSNIASTAPNQCEVKYSMILCFNTALNATTSGQIIEDYNAFYGSGTVRSNVATGAHSVSSNNYAILLEVGQSALLGLSASPVPHLSPFQPSYLNTFIPTTASGLPSTDMNGVPRPGATSMSLGAMERFNCAVVDTTIAQDASGASYRIDGAGSHELYIPVDAGSYSLTIYGYYDASYDTTAKPQVIAYGAGLASPVTATMVGASGTWEQMTLNVSPTVPGVLTLRLVSRSSVGKAYFDTFNM